MNWTIVAIIYLMISLGLMFSLYRSEYNYGIHEFSASDHSEIIVTSLGWLVILSGLIVISPVWIVFKLSKPKSVRELERPERDLRDVSY